MGLGEAPDLKLASALSSGREESIISVGKASTLNIRGKSGNKYLRTQKLTLLWQGKPSLSSKYDHRQHKTYE
jgi:hypothetical protein